ncbi:MAG TPA: TRAP transporter substrate-binding protein, partial [Candidatus Methylomirabilis sp.]|nr:TRAP transporter substrate-binding protein [Candidatus Methylomirabilis sp.]
TTVLLLFAWTASPTPAKAGEFPKMQLKLGHVGVVDMSYHKGSLKFAELIKERTGGAITVDVFPDSQLGSEKDMLEQVKNGVIHMSLTGPSMLAQFKGWGPIGVLSMPYVLKGDTEDALRPKLIKLARGPLMAELNEKAAQESGVRILDMGWWYGERHLTTKTKQVVRPDDIKGLKIRTMDSPVARAAMANLGAATTPMAVSELYTALQLGVVEGQENPLNTIYSHKFYEVQKYVALTGHMAMNLVLVINNNFYNSLSPELRDLFVKTMADAGNYESELQIAMNKKNLQDLKDKGMTVTVVNKAEFAEKTKDAWKEFEPIFGKGFYEKVVEAAK